MLNLCVITGNLGSDPQVYFTPDGVPVTSFNIAFQSSKKKTCWIKIVTFRTLAEVCAKYLKKGNRIAVSGVLDEQKYSDKDGQNRSHFQIIGGTVEFIKVDESVFKEGEAASETINDETPF